MHCELVIPSLFRTGAGDRLAALELLLARGRRRGAPARSLEDWLRDAFDLGEQPLAAGALTLLGCGGDPGNAHHARADPVHLRVMRDHLVAEPGDSLEVSREEAEALCAALKRHFTEMDFVACEPRRWCVRLAESLAVLAGNPLEIAGRDASLPREAARLLNEAQMVLHEHPVNQAREARGEPPVNSIWLWGGGRAQREASCAWQSVAADDPVARGAAKLAGARHHALPRSATAWLEGLPADGRHLALLDALRSPLGQQETLEGLEKRWFAPLLDALRAGRVGMVTLQVPDAAEGLCCETIRADLRRFWRVARPIERYA